MSQEREVIIDFANALEAACVNLRMKLGDKTQEQSFTWNPFKIKWQPKEGTHGAYELSEDYNNLDFKAMLKDLEQHKGGLTRDSIFYWIFQNGSSVGRKVKQKQA